MNNVDVARIAVEVLLYVCGAIITIGGAYAIIDKISTKNIKSISKDMIDESTKELSQSFNAELKELATELRDFMKESRTADEQIKKNLLDHARDRINEAYNYYVKTVGYIDAHTLFTLEQVHTDYNALKGNTFVDQEMEELRELFHTCNNKDQIDELKKLLSAYSKAD